MARFLPDTNCLVAVALPTHPDHEAALGEMNRRVARNDQMVLAGHSLAEAYSVLTRIPVAQRLTPEKALDVLGPFMAVGELVSLEPSEYVAVVTSAPAGGRVYDALIAECARKAGVDELLTFNFRHFDGLVPGVKVVIPVP